MSHASERLLRAPHRSQYWHASQVNACPGSRVFPILQPMIRLTPVRFATAALRAAGQSRARALLLLAGGLQRTPAHP